MLGELEQMLEISRALSEAAEKSDVDRIVTLLKRRAELTGKMGNVNPEDPDVKSGEVARMLREIVRMDGEIEGKIRSVMGTLQNAMKSVQGEQKLVEGYLKQTEVSDPRLIDKEG